MIGKGKLQTQPAFCDIMGHASYINDMIISSASHIGDLDDFEWIYPFHCINQGVYGINLPYTTLSKLKHPTSSISEAFVGVNSSEN